MRNNSLTKFESEVFKTMLEQMATSTGRPYLVIQQSKVLFDFFYGKFLFCFSWLLFLKIDPFDCAGCALSWLVRDNPNLLNRISGGRCANGTWFDDLDPASLVDCP